MGFSGHMWLLRASQLWEAGDVLNCLNTDSFEQLKDSLEIVLVKGFSLVGSQVTNIKATTYTNYTNQYTARDTAGKGYGNLAANIGPTSENPFTKYNF